MADRGGYDPQRIEELLLQQGASPEGVSLSTTQGAAPAGGGFDPSRLDAALNAPPAPEPSVMGEVTGVASQTNQAIADVVGAPVDIVNAVLGMVSGGRLSSEEPFGGSASIRRLLPGEVQPQTMPGRFAGRVGREALSGVTAGLGAAAAAAKLATMPGRIGEFAKRLGTLDRAQLARVEAMLSAWTGSGAATVGEVGRSARATPEQRRWLDLAGQLVGAFGAAGARGLLGFFKGRTQAGAERLVGEALSEAIPVGSAQERNLAATRGLRTEVPEVPVTTAQATGSAALGAETGRLAGAPRRGAQLQEQPSQATTAVQQRIEAVQPTGDVRAAQRAAREADAARVAAETRAADTEQARLATNFKKSADALDARMGEFIASAKRDVEGTLRQLGNPKDRTAASEAILDAIAREDLRVKTEAGKLFDQVPANVPLDLTRLDETVGRAAAYAGESLRPDVFPETLKNLAAKLQDHAGTGTFGEVRRWRSDLLTELRNEAGGANPDRDKMRLLNVVLDRVQETLDQAGDASAAYRAASAAYKDYVTRFRQGIVAKVLRKGPRGEETRIAVETAAGEFFRSGKDAPTRAKALVAAVGNEPDAMAAVRDYAIGNFLEAAAPGTKGATQRATRWLTKHREALDAFPGVRDEVQRVIAGMRGVDTAEKLAARVRGMLEKGQLPAAANPAQLAARPREAVEDAVVREFAGADPGNAIGTVLNRPDRGQQTRKLVQMVGGDPLAMDGLRRGFIENMQQSIAKGDADAIGKSPLLSPDAMRQYLDRHTEVVEVLFPGAAGARLRQLQKVAEVVLFPNRVASNAGLMEGLTQPQLYTMSQLISRAYGLERGVVGRSYFVSELLLKTLYKVTDAIGRGHLQRVMDRALFDPEAAELLLTLSRRAMANQQAAVTAIEAYAAALGPTAARALSPSDRERNGASPRVP